MRNFVFILVILPLFSFAQAETQAYQEASAKFEQYYNAEDYEEIFKMFSSTMQKSLPLDQFKVTAQQIKQQLGSIQSREYKGITTGTSVIYKTTFENGVAGLYMTLNTDNELDGLWIKPYEESTSTESE